jgi:hypothetical protein
MCPEPGLLLGRQIRLAIWPDLTGPSHLVEMG